MVQDLWTTVGFKVTVELLDTVPWRQARSEGTFHRVDPGPHLSVRPGRLFWAQSALQERVLAVLSGWQNARYDQLVEEAKRTLDPARRKELYTEAWNIVNVELPFFYLHEITQTSAAVKELRGYQPGSAGALTYHGGGLRTAYIEAIASGGAASAYRRGDAPCISSGASCRLSTALATGLGKGS